MPLKEIQNTTLKRQLNSMSSLKYKELRQLRLPIMLLKYSLSRMQLRSQLWPNSRNKKDKDYMKKLRKRHTKKKWKLRRLRDWRTRRDRMSLVLSQHLQWLGRMRRMLNKFKCLRRHCRERKKRQRRHKQEQSKKDQSKNKLKLRG